MSAVREVLMPGTPAEAVELFGDGGNITVIGGGTIVVPAVAAGRIAPARALFLGHAGLSGITRTGRDGHDRRDDLCRLTCRARRAARRVRGERRRPGGARARPPSAATSARPETARCRAATCRAHCSRSTRRCAHRVPAARGPSRSSSSSQRARDGSLLDVSYREPAAGAFAAIDYPHTHTYTVLAVSAARSQDGVVRLAASGLAGTGQLGCTPPSGSPTTRGGGCRAASEAASPTTRSPPRGTARRRCRCSSGVRSPSSRSHDEPLGQRHAARDRERPARPRCSTSCVRSSRS